MNAQRLTTAAGTHYRAETPTVPTTCDFPMCCELAARILTPDGGPNAAWCIRHLPGWASGEALVSVLTPLTLPEWADRAAQALQHFAPQSHCVRRLPALRPVGADAFEGEDEELHRLLCPGCGETQRALLNVDFVYCAGCGAPFTPAQGMPPKHDEDPHEH